MKTVVKALVLAASLAASNAAMAQEVAECDWRNAASAVLEPWEEYTRTFANGDVRIAVIDMVEPGVAPLHLLVLSPPYDELNIRQCKLVTFEGTRGFADLNFAALDAAYDPSVGLIFTMPIRVYDIDTADMRDTTLRFTLNQATGQMGAQFVQ
ncbi:MAG: hypothetical protein AAFY35_10245 [Pseudomonadota bacterium]